jgi:hypothetical protein
MGFQGKDYISNKICIYSKLTEQIDCFKCLGYCITYGNKKKKDISETARNYNRAMRIKNQELEFRNLGYT